METRRQSHQPSDESAAAGSQHAIARTCACRATGSGQMRLYVRRRYGPSFLQLIGAVEELEVAKDSEDVARAVSVIRGRTNYTHKNSRSRH